jgi:hypothetical protein
MSDLTQPTGITFDVRPAAYGPFLISDSLGNILPGTAIEIGDSITLHIGPVLVICTVTAKDNETYNGRIAGFEGFPGLDFHGLLVDSTVEFFDTQVFGCTKRT